MSSFAILHTNVGLTTNVKLVVDSDYNLYLDSINSNSELSSSKYKKLRFSKDNFWDELVPFFFKNCPSEIAYFIKDDNDSQNMSSNFDNQFDDLYQYGARNIIENKDYTEEYEYFAPLHIDRNKFPKSFIIFRIDGPGIINLTSQNFREECLKKLKTIKLFDLTNKTTLGEWIDRSFTSNPNFPINSLYIDFRRMEFSSFSGIDYEGGGYSEKSVMLDTLLEKEQTFFDMENFLFNGWKNNKVIYPNIINFSFLFDDTPATPNSIRRWSLNRYLGFYLDDLEVVKSVSPYNPPKLKEDVIIEDNNILRSLNTGDPFLEDWKNNDNPYLEINGEFYKIQRYIESINIGGNITQNNKWKIISDVSLVGKQNLINKSIIKVTTESGLNKITSLDGTPLIIDGFDNADVWLIQIDDTYHNLIKTGNDYYINTDSAFSQSLDKFEWWVNYPDPNFRRTLNLDVDSDNPPKVFKIWKIKFSDIKDFDTKIVDTDFSKFEYENKLKLTITDEPKMYIQDLRSLNNPKDLDDFRIGGEVVNIPVSSEYLCNYETFRITEGELSGLWKKNSKRVKWGFDKSLSSNDYPYLLNNSLVAEDFNRSPNPFNLLPNRVDRNLDYFLTIGHKNENYTHQSLHLFNEEVTFSGVKQSITGEVILLSVSEIKRFSIGDRILIVSNNFSHETQILEIYLSNNSITTNSNNLDIVSGTLKNLSSNTFQLDKYISNEKDYFSYFFSKINNFDGELKNTKKFSNFGHGDKTIPNTTLWKGLKFKLWDVSSIKISDNKIENINISSQNLYDDWKFSVLLSKNNFSVSGSVENPNIGTVSYTNNTLRWKIIDEWKHDKIYQKGDYALSNGVLWKSMTQSQIKNPNIYPHNSNEWTIYGTFSIFWSPNIDNNMIEFASKFGLENLLPLVWRHDEWYYKVGNNGPDFWDISQSYIEGDVVLHKNKTWISTNNNQEEPGSNSYWVDNGVNIKFWIETEVSENIWEKVTYWDFSLVYSSGNYVLHEDIIWVSSSDENQGSQPNISDNWLRIWGMNPDTNFIYKEGITNNNIVKMNNRYYICEENKNSSTLDNGIIIYINKKWKNVLVNIYINDNTFAQSSDPGLVNYTTWTIFKDYTSDTNRDDIYSDIYYKLTANNFVNSINNLENNFGFSDKVKYFIINEDGTCNLYDFNNLNFIQGLPNLLTVEFPDELFIKPKSFIIQPQDLSESRISPIYKLNDGKISSISEINYYNDNIISASIVPNVSDSKSVANFSGLKNIIYNRIWRYSGFYSPIFLEIDLFDRGGEENPLQNFKFNTNLTSFGKIKEKINSKVNRKSNILKLRNDSDLKSQYPMLDEFGYGVNDFFIFKSNWDLEYYIECVEPTKPINQLRREETIKIIPKELNEKTNNQSQI